MTQKTTIFFGIAFLLVSGIFLTIHVASQQVLRMSANDPQIQMAEDSVVLLNSGRNPESLLTAGNVDIRNSLAPFLIILDKTGKPLASSAYLDNQVPSVPAGALDAAAGMGENRVTWQPKQGVRIAAVITVYNNGFILAGRNMREVEKRESGIELIVGAAYVAALALLGLAWFVKQSFQNLGIKKDPIA